jgi:hypothetical protein
MTHPELNINFNPQDVANLIAASGGRCHDTGHTCTYNGTTGHMSYHEARVIAKTLSDTAAPLMKWVAVDIGDFLGQISEFRGDVFEIVRHCVTYICYV